MKRRDVSNCVFSKWLPLFHAVTIPSKVIPLPEAFVAYLNEDGIVLPAAKGDRDSISLSHDDDWDESNELPVPRFDALRDEVEECIHGLGGIVFPKLTWSAPRDASWISADGSLRCHSFNDICLLLKSSDFVAHDLMHAYDDCEDSNAPRASDEFELVIRKWIDIAPSMEFRCFVKSDILVGISQRHPCTFFPFLVNEEHYITSSIQKFFEDFVKGKFLDSTFVFDVYQENEGNIRLLDFNPFGRVTDSLLFTWDELEAIDVSSHAVTNVPQLRIVSSNNGIQPSPYLSYRLPRDLIVSSSEQGIQEMIAFFQGSSILCKANENSEQ